MNAREFEIPVPWGFVAVKAWGNETDTPILTIHGIGDNVGSFDRLLPFLPTSFYYICIDLPNHGKSSPYPAHLVTIFDNVYTIKLVVDYLDRKKYIFMGHSWGGHITIFFNQLFPEYAIKLILLEAFYLFPTPVNEMKLYVTGIIKSWIKLSEIMAQNKPLLHTYEEAMTKVCSKRMFGSLLSREAAEPMLKRVLIPAEGGKFVFSHTSQLSRSIKLLYDIEFIANSMKEYPINCPALFVYASETHWFNHYNFAKVVEVLKNNKHCILKKIISNDHEIHNHHPEIVGPIVTDFLNDVKSKL